MKILTLNKKQEKLLIQMCKEFFPELQQKSENEGIKWCKENSEDIKEYEIGFRLSDENHNTLVYCSYPIDYGFHIHLLPNDKNPGIHWYQLCLTELPKRIFGNLKNEVTNKAKIYIEPITLCEVQETALYGNHPVDSLKLFVTTAKKNKWFKTKSK